MPEQFTKQQLQDAFELIESHPIKGHIVGYLIVNEECPMCGSKLEGEEGCYACKNCGCHYIREQEGSEGHMPITE